MKFAAFETATEWCSAALWLDGELRSVEERFDIAVVDLNMPPPDGWAVLEALLRHDPTLPVVIATGYGTEAEVLERGGVALIQKPYGRDALVRAVERFARTRA